MNAVDIHSLTKKYDDNLAVDDVNLEIAEGDIFGLLGPNGAGKSTTINMICGLIKPTSGKIKVFGQEIEKSKGIIGYVPQSLAIYPDFSGKENIQFFGSLYGLSHSELKQKTDEVLEFTKLTDAKNRKAKTYSGGMMRRLNIACALVHSPKLVIMDEPTVGIDPQSRNHIMSAIKRMNKQGVTVIYTSHYMEEIEQLCNQISIIDHGKIIVKGTKEELKSLVTDQNTMSISGGEISEECKNQITAIEGVVSIKQVDYGYEIISEKNKSNLNDILDVLLKNKIPLNNIAYKEVDLETVFLSLTGRKLRD